MCEITEKIYNEGLAEGEARGKVNEAKKNSNEFGWKRILNRSNFRYNRSEF